MIKDGIRPGDVKQGSLGDCWFLGACMVLASRPELLRNLIVHDGIEQGFAVFQFFKNGAWTPVFIDTRIPYNKDTKMPIYARCADPNEYWVPLIEKAFAKLHGSYEALDGGSLSQGMVDLTGGVSEKMFLETPDIKEMIESDQLWKDMKKYKA
jgi:calpain